MNLKNVFVISLIFTVIVMISLQLTGSHLITPASPLGIVSFEFSKDLHNANLIIGSWGEKGRSYAGLNLGLDYLFIVLYTITLISACLLIINERRGASKVIYSVGRIMIISSLTAGLLDCIENFALIQILTGKGSDNLVTLARYCAIPKFLLLGFIILFIISGWSFLKLNSFKK